MEFLYYCMYNSRTLVKISLLVEAAGERYDTHQFRYAQMEHQKPEGDGEEHDETGIDTGEQYCCNGG